jgi:hypothetical protein
VTDAEAAAVRVLANYRASEARILVAIAAAQAESEAITAAREANQRRMNDLGHQRRELRRELDVALATLEPTLIAIGTMP